MAEYDPLRAIALVPPYVSFAPNPGRSDGRETRRKAAIRSDNGQSRILQSCHCESNAGDADRLLRKTLRRFEEGLCDLPLQ